MRHTQKRLTYGDLPNSPAPGVSLHCACGSWSASRGDYFLRGDTEPIEDCRACDERLILARVRSRLERVRPAEAGAR